VGKIINLASANVLIKAIRRAALSVTGGLFVLGRTALIYGVITIATVVYEQ
jgi:hypothetical protein